MGMTTIDQQIAELFNKNFNLGGSWNWGNLLLCIIAMLLSILLCGIVGFEREMKGRSAGFRTHLLVGLGSCVIMIISIYGFPLMFTEDATGISRDVARLAAAIITGVGFLGAGTIIHNQSGVKGLTTASTIWIVMAIGIACGSMNFIIAILVTLVTMIVLVLFRKFEKHIKKNCPMFLITASIEKPILADLIKIVEELDYSLHEVNSTIASTPADCVQISFTVSSNKNNEVDLVKFTTMLEKIESVKHIQIQNQH